MAGIGGGGVLFTVRVSTRTMTQWVAGIFDGLEISITVLTGCCSFSPSFGGFGLTAGRD